MIKIKKRKTPFEKNTLEDLKDKITKIDRKISTLEMQQNQFKQNQRAARTRTLIQLGGLLVKSGVSEKLGINIGADLQRDGIQRKKAYALLGMLVSQLVFPKNTQEMENLGRHFLSENQNKEEKDEEEDISKNLVID